MTGLPQRLSRNRRDRSRATARCADGQVRPDSAYVRQPSAQCRRLGLLQSPRNGNISVRGAFFRGARGERHSSSHSKVANRLSALGCRTTVPSIPAQQATKCMALYLAPRIPRRLPRQPLFRPAQHPVRESPQNPLDVCVCHFPLGVEGGFAAGPLLVARNVVRAFVRHQILPQGHPPMVPTAPPRARSDSSLSQVCSLAHDDSRWKGRAISGMVYTEINRWKCPPCR